jgi:opacity protein-like surface antigen
MIFIKIFLLLIIFTFKNSMAAPFNGFYAGVAAHHTSRNTQTTFPPHITTHHDTTHQLSSIDKNSKSNYWGGTLIGGYGHSRGDCYCGIEAGIESPNMEEKSSFSSSFTMTPTVPAHPLSSFPTPSVTPPPSSSTKYHISTTFKRGWVTSIGPRVGIIIQNNHLIYLKIGIESSSNSLIHTIYHDSSSSVSKKSTKKNRISIVPSLGTEKIFFPNLITRLEYSYDLGSQLELENISTHYRTHKFKIGLIYQF